MLLEDISRFTVARAEVKAGTALLASSRIFFHNLYQDVASRSPGEFKLTIHSYIQDATNSGILKGSKLAALILRSAYLRDYVANAADGCEDETYDFDDAQNFDFTSWFETIVRVADILPVHGSDSAVTAAQTLKHLEGLNECGARKILAADVADQPNTFFADFTCLEHSQHLVSLSCLKAADRCLAKHREWSYYASLATCSNVCRSLCKAIFDAWAQRHGYRSAKDECRQLWPKASSGRWSGCDKPEHRFLQTGMDKLAPIMMDVLSKSLDNDKKHSCVEIDELQIEESKAFSAKMGRWRKRAKGCFSDNLWWVTVGIMNACRGPLTHLQNFLQKPVDHRDQGEMDNLMHAASGYNRKITVPMGRGITILFALAADHARHFSALSLCGRNVRLFITLRGVAGMVQPDVQASERLNKMLSLFGQRCPSGSLDLCTARACMKHFLGVNGYGLGGKRRFSDVKETAKHLFDECVSGWPLIEDVDKLENRFAPAETRSDLLSLSDANKKYRECDPFFQPRVTPATLWAASMNSKLSKRRAQRKFSYCVDGLPAISFVMSPKGIDDAVCAPLIFLVTDKVRTAIHLVAFRRQTQADATANGPFKYAIHTPWSFTKSHDALLRFYNLLKDDQTTISAVEFLVRVHNDATLEPIDGTSTTLLTFQRMDHASKTTFTALADETDHNTGDGDDSDGPGSDDDDDDNSEPQGFHELSSLMQQFRSENPERQPEFNVNLDDPVDALNEFVEDADAEDCSNLNVPDSELARQSAAKSLGETDMEGDADADEWINEQMSQTLEKERSQFESEIAGKALKTGANIQGQNFMEIAESVVAEP
ncbi:unnamed protein product [Cladocopium goreaui]|uniref:Uncharacterized protein n=1 Tax=Cladocopium goreaui TaxID=2562237 RepID=A0A9P1CQF0_9DINO|nr:unnamed protein product [Cladocopium goreaui]